MKKFLFTICVLMCLFGTAQVEVGDCILFYPNNDMLSYGQPDHGDYFLGVITDTDGGVYALVYFRQSYPSSEVMVDVEFGVQSNGTMYFVQDDWCLGDNDVVQPLTASDDLDFPATSALTYTELTMTVTGAQVGDIVSCSYPAIEGMFTASVTDADEVTIKYFSVAGNNPAEATFNVMVFPQ